MKKNILIVLFALCTFAGVSQTTLDTAINFNGTDPYGNYIDLYSYLDDGKIQWSYTLIISADEQQCTATFIK